MTNNVFALDANVFIEAARRYYAFDIAPAFWNALITHAEDQRIVIIDRIMDEIKRGNDTLAEWITNLKPWCKSTGEDDVIEAYKEIITWAYNQAQFKEEAKSEFADSPDGWLIAYAKAKGLVVVTHEKLEINAKKTIPIPNVCEAFHVKYIDTFNMLRILGIRF